MPEKSIYQSYSEEIYDFIEKGELLVENILTTNDPLLEEFEISELKAISIRFQEIRLDLDVSSTEIKELGGSKKDQLAEAFYAEIDAVFNTLCSFVYKLIDRFLHILGQVFDTVHSDLINLSSQIIEMLEYNYITILKQFNFAEPILLTNEELYYALTFLNDEQVRIVLSEQTNKNFNKILSAYNNGCNSFLSELEDLDFDRSKGIRFVLCTPVNKAFPFENYIEQNLKIETSIGKALADEVFGDGTSETLRHIKSSNSKCESINDLQHKFGLLCEMESKAGPTLARLVSFYNDPENEELGKDRNLDLYEGSSQTVNNIVFCIIDKWIRWAINQRMMQLELHSINESSQNEEKNQSSSSVRRISFPSRIEQLKLLPQQKNEILSGLYSEFGHYFETYTGKIISSEEFIHLFSGRINRPDNYATPYYWNGDVNTFAGLIRLLYMGQEHGLDYIILPVKDKDKTKSSIKWSSRKQGLGKPILKPIEDKIQGVVEAVAGKRLKEVELTKQNKPKEEKSNKKAVE